MNYRSKISDCDKNNKNNQYMKQNGNFFLKTANLRSIWNGYRIFLQNKPAAAAGGCRG